MNKSIKADREMVIFVNTVYISYTPVHLYSIRNTLISLILYL